jgi:hypothetical protein
VTYKHVGAVLNCVCTVYIRGAFVDVMIGNYNSVKMHGLINVKIWVKYFEFSASLLS